MISNCGSIAKNPARMIARRSFLVYIFFCLRRSSLEGRLARFKYAIRRYLGNSSPFIGATVIPLSQSSFFLSLAIILVYHKRSIKSTTIPPQTGTFAGPRISIQYEKHALKVYNLWFTSLSACFCFRVL